MIRASCGSCHEIPGVQEADGLVGPPLTHFSQRTMIAGLLPNTPANLEYWLQQPQAVTPGNGMPDLGLSDHDARDIAAYLDRIR
jgi:cytochrome c1